MSVSRKLYPLLQCHVSEIRIKIVRHTPCFTLHILFFFFFFPFCCNVPRHPFVRTEPLCFRDRENALLHYINDPCSSKLAKSGLFLQDFEVIGLRLQFSF